MNDVSSSYFWMHLGILPRFQILCTQDNLKCLPLCTTKTLNFRQARPKLILKSKCWHNLWLMYTIFFVFHSLSFSVFLRSDKCKVYFFSHVKEADWALTRAFRGDLPLSPLFHNTDKVETSNLLYEPMKGWSLNIW